MTETFGTLIDLDHPNESWFERVKIRRLLPSDLPALEWSGEFVHFRRLYAEVYERMRSGLALMWVADLPGEGIIGQAFVQFHAARPELADGRKKAYLHSFRVQPAYRGAGVGSRIMQVIENDLCRRGYKTITLNVSRTNQRALRLYRRLNYLIVGKDPGRWSYVDHNGTLCEVDEPGWRMQKILAEGG
jgi:ribosomal protein S18 acetylase RimI-like enzyme